MSCSWTADARISEIKLACILRPLGPVRRVHPARSGPDLRSRPTLALQKPGRWRVEGSETAARHRPTTDLAPCALSTRVYILL
ncbi:hypothetical protein BD311DRAFT_772029 [Dichomitus squalens]|uniref:Uncharacterized protein n=1 Tax=Dichomitus squalens TaxID=114155 RepID=A0A4Q9M3Z0_9APHY|nr:hypothetical protein BD311DRAFT_772029 [Dichomitus squalens]TBU62413.1 hypothetical protein BD310DRAFT_48873 [Dichomitus squalens]